MKFRGRRIHLFKILSWTAGGLVVTVICLVAAFLWKPEIILTPQRLHSLAFKARTLGFGLSWVTDDLEIKSHSFFEKEFKINFTDLCLNIQSLGAQGCLDTFNLDAVIAYKHSKLHLIEVSTLRVHGSNVVLNLKPSSPSPESRPGFFSKLFSDFMGARTYFHGMDIDLKNFSFSSGESSYEGDFIVADGPRAGPGTWSVAGSLNGKDLKSQLRLTASINVEGSLAPAFKPLTTSLTLHLVVPHGVDLNAKLDHHFTDEDSSLYHIQLNALLDNSQKIHGSLSGTSKGEKTHGTFQALFHDASYDLDVGGDSPCRYEVTFSKLVQIECPVQMKPVLPKKMQMLAPLFHATKIIVGIDLKSYENFSPSGLWDGNLHLDFMTAQNSQQPYNFNGKVAAHFQGEPLSEKILQRLQGTSDISFQVPEFEKLVTELKATPFAVPSPLNVLKGPMQCALRGTMDVSKIAVPVTCTTHLKSEVEALELKASGSLVMKKIAGGFIPHLDLDILLQNIQLVLPRFGIKGPPPMIPDTRFKHSLVEKKIESKTPFSYKITVHTAGTHDLRFISNLASAPVPISLNLMLDSSQPPEGWVQINEVTEKLFRREATVKFLNLSLSSHHPEYVKGLIEVKYTDYTIKIMINGTFQEPTVAMDSVPPASQNDIISILLFGRTVDESDIGQTTSVSNTQAAIADKALALSSMYLLASTPVESVGYDSQSQSFTAKVRLTEGTSLNVGASGASVSEVGVNRHLGGPWYIYTYVKNPSDDEDRTTAAFLEWILRY